MVNTTTRVALMMDQRAFRDTLAFWLMTARGIQVTTVRGSGACHAAVSAQPDVVVYQPDDMAQVLSICEDIATQKVLILLGSSSDGTIDRAVRAGVRGCMLASDSAGVLLEGIRAVAAGEYWFSETIRDRLVFDPSTRCYSVTAPNGVASLSKRQLQVLHHAAEGRTNREAAELMQISEKSIETHMYRMMQKLGVHNRVQLVRMAMREGVVAP